MDNRAQSRIKMVSFALISILLGVASTALTLEAVLRAFPVNEGLHVTPVNQDNPILKFAPNRISTWSKGWNFSIVNKVKTNNYGFVNDIDYDPNATTPLLAIVGDSYVEAAMVPYKETAAGILARALAPKARVYSFGSSGSALSQYLAYCRYARDTFRPDALVIVVDGNDYSESLLQYKSAPAFHYFTKSPDGTLVLQRVDFEVTPWRSFVRRSALGMYLATNVHAQSWANYIKNYFPQFVSQTSPSLTDASEGAERKHIVESQGAVETFLKLLPSLSGLPPSKIIMVVDGMRETIYNTERVAAIAAYIDYVDVMRRYLIAKAQAGGFEVIDMQPRFLEHYRRYGQRFEFATDNHWNPLGHAVVADAVQRSMMYRTVFGEVVP
jgi:hypothetical protein